MKQYIIKCIINNIIRWTEGPTNKQERDILVKKCRIVDGGVASVQTISKMFSSKIILQLNSEIGNIITENKLDKILQIKTGNMSNKRKRRIEYINNSKLIKANIEKLNLNSKTIKYKIF